MTKRLLDAAKAATQLATWSDLKDNLLDEGSSVVSDDSEDNLLSARDNDDETNDNINDPSLVNSPGHRQVQKMKWVMAARKRVTEMIPQKAATLLPKTHLGEEMVRYGLPHVLQHQEHVHVISDTPEKDQSEKRKTSKWSRGFYMLLWWRYAKAGCQAYSQ